MSKERLKKSREKLTSIDESRKDLRVIVEMNISSTEIKGMLVDEEDKGNIFEFEIGYHYYENYDEDGKLIAAGITNSYGSNLNEINQADPRLNEIILRTLEVKYE